MELMTCPSCFVRMLPKQDGTCPACAVDIRSLPPADPQYCQLLIKQIEPPVGICHCCGEPTERMVRCRAEGGKEHGRQPSKLLAAVSLLLSPILTLIALSNETKRSQIVDVSIPCCDRCLAKHGKPKPLNIAYEAMGMLFKVHVRYRDRLLESRAASAGASSRVKGP